MSQHNLFTIKENNLNYGNSQYLPQIGAIGHSACILYPSVYSKLG